MKTEAAALPLSIEVNGLLPILGRLDGMLHQLRNLKGRDLSHEFAQWQTEDVHRRYPYVLRRRGRPITLLTRFRPHSRYEMRRHYAAQCRLIRKGRYAGYTSMRPILREEMIEALEERLHELLADVHW
jgi:hypothetical protein